MSGEQAPPPPDIERLATNAARFIEQGGRALAAYMQPYQKGDAGEIQRNDFSDLVAVALTSIGRVAEHWTSDPARLAEAQAAIATPFLQLWAQTYRRMLGEKVEPVVPIPKGDKRYTAPEWSNLPLYDFLRQAHAISAEWAENLVERSTELDPRTRAKAKFYLRQIASALAPANFIATNPELLRQTLQTSGENLARGALHLAEDMEAGGGQLRIRQTDPSSFKFGENVAATPGHVVFRNELIELIQYTPTTESVLRRPLLIIPPWINKFYIMDLSAEKSLVRWVVEQGVTVFMVSWVNPDERHRDKTFASYIHEGIFAGLDAVKAATGEDRVNAIGYCVGGTLLATALAYMAQTGDERIQSATFFAAQTDFSDAGDIQVFIDEEQLRALEAKMEGKGYLEGAKMAMAFNMLRPNDLVWSYFVDNYMRGKTPAPFDLLYWNSDSTRLPIRNHTYYLRNFYIDNKLAKGEMEIGGIKLELGKVKVPAYFVAAKDDHIAPAASVYRGARLFGGEVRYTLAGSGHIAGIINPPIKNKYFYSTGPKPHGELKDWVPQSVKHDGSWWPDWMAWLIEQAPERVEARVPGAGGLPVLGPAPGEYVRVKS
ncbi:MAG: class I poly(R)-hydroxyalkanoic acid synthase [Beijerinckiaceae bacterium]|nr:class I poly(R)-hydroxyalkanoic acid synthase [Beijerinckiaceae bacterium]